MFGDRQVALLHRWAKDEDGREVDVDAVGGAGKIHYQIGDHLGSAALELDADGKLISYEEYFPFGGSSFVTGRSKREVVLKEYRYSGKLRDDVTGFYYYGWRYYAPWMGGWLSPDPIGPEDGLNLYRFVRNNPVRFVDADGLETVPDRWRVERGLAEDLKTNSDEARRRIKAAIDANPHFERFDAERGENVSYSLLDVSLTWDAQLGENTYTATVVELGASSQFRSVPEGQPSGGKRGAGGDATSKLTEEGAQAVALRLVLPTFNAMAEGMSGDDGFWDAVGNRVMGGLMVIGGTAEAVVGAAGMAAPEPLTTAGGGLLFAHGVDTASAGLRQLWSGETERTFTSVGIEELGVTLGLSREEAARAAFWSELGLGVAGAVGASQNVLRLKNLNQVSDKVIGATKPQSAGGSGDRLVHLTTPATASKIAAEGTLRGPAGIYAGPISNASARGIGITARTGLSSGQAGAAVNIPNSASGAFTRPVPIGPITFWQRLTGQQFTAAGSLDLATGVFTRTGVNWNQFFLYGTDVAFTGTAAAYATEN